MTTPSSGPSGFEDSEVNLGGADAVEKTSYVLGRGTDPEAMRGDAEALPAEGGGGIGLMGWVLIAAALAIVLYLGLAVFR